MDKASRRYAKIVNYSRHRFKTDGYSPLKPTERGLALSDFEVQAHLMAGLSAFSALDATSWRFKTASDAHYP